VVPGSGDPMGFIDALHGFPVPRSVNLHGSPPDWTWGPTRILRLRIGDGGAGPRGVCVPEPETPWSTVRSFVPMVVFSALAVLTLGGCAHRKASPLRTVAHVDLDRYLGRWYVIANIPYFLEKGKVASYDTYARRPDGKLDNLFTFRKGGFDAPEQTWRGTAWVVDRESNAEWKVRFLWPLTSTYLVLELDPEYQWAVVGTPGRNLLWILARDRQLTPEVYERILGLIEAQGYDRSKIVPVPQPVPPRS
jgi:apolipoprotein D and lipocalin family protein